MLHLRLAVLLNTRGTDVFNLELDKQKKHSSRGVSLSCPGKDYPDSTSLRCTVRNAKKFNSVYVNAVNVLINYNNIDSNVPYIKQQKSPVFTSAILLKKPHTTKNWKYLARDGKRPDKSPSEEAISVEEGSDSVRHLALMSKLQNCSSLSEQIETFISELSLTSEDFKKRTAFCKELEEIFGIYFPKFKVHQFGSSVNGLGFKGCDLDVCLQTNFADEAVEDYVQLQDVPSLEDVKNGVVPPEIVLRMTPYFMLRFVRRMLFFHCTDINKVLVIKARCPILRFYRSKYDIFCDFSLESKISVRNTMLLWLLCHLDERFPVLTKIIRYWGKYGGFVGDIDRFNSYSFSLLVVHFLQTRNPPVLPPINEVYSKSEYLQRISLEDTGLMFEDIKKFSPSSNTKTVEELLREFFFHYLTYDFSRIMQPSLSSSIPVADFVPDKDSEDKFEVNTVNIQDPFRPNFNVTAVPSFESCIRFRNGLYLACETYQNKIFTPSAENWGLPLIFNRPPSETKMHEQWKKNLFHTIEIPASPDAADKVKEILEHALLFNCSPCYIDSEDCSDSKVILKLQCKVHHNTWTGRDWVLEKLKDSNSQLPLETEHLISKELISQSEKGRQILNEFTCECKENSDGKLSVELNFKESKAPFLAVFLKEYIPSMIKKF
ncbi:Poly(A) RNA polymerase, mitochondrial [Araneus ventricosus]|uniref:Poly(A) RNA polymerase, mitochondrial n=1 Tax=Araneus ventricosus TaxID=182803 RepID=A0A4Y2E2B3_ARAVE|nr:Poly(A) RNA polymerase, mitochondrial [Araneus ventricosus]